MTAEYETIDLKGFEKIYQALLSREETAELVVPDTMPDVGRILDADGTLAIRSKAVDSGRVTVGGKLTAWALYVPEDGGGMRTLSTVWEFSITADAPDVEPDCPAIVELKLASMDARMLNPRKLMFRADIRADVRCWRRQNRQLLCGIKNAEEYGIQQRTSEVCCARAVAVTEKTFVLTDDYILPSAAPYVDEFIGGRVRAVVDETKPIGSKQVLRGTVFVTLLYMGNGGELCSHGFSTAFSQLIETDTECAEPGAEIALTPTSVFLEVKTEAQPRSFGMELHLLAQAIVYDSGRQRCLTDAYSTRFPLVCERERLTLEGAPTRSTARESVRELVRTRTPAVRVHDAAAVTGDAALSGGTVRCPVTVRVIYADADGQLWGISERLQVSSDMGTGPDADGKLRALCGDVFAVPAEGGVEVRFPVELTLDAASAAAAELISSVDVGEEPLPRRGRPSLALTRCAAERSLWDMAKDCCSTVAAIREANCIDDGEPAVGDLLLIPTVF